MKHIRVAAIIRHQNKILLHTTKNENYWTLPGGAVENELTKEGLQREMREELGEEVTIRELKIIAENRFVYRGEEMDSIEFYYIVELYPNSALLELSTFTKIEQFGQNGETDYELNFKWFEIEKVSEIEILPKFLQTELTQLSSDRIKHIQ
ncbi:NUDIX hydrolase [Listeria monocytogenes]|nr:NUDIX domain-containing protein [Listeria monocytogenes]EAD0944828.1 NUDIX domain-containing protein [Listeria monocytogenes]EAD1176525.1 NUDIX domain-containing protein [Listeria monocytogenes]EAE3012966.1 NUDIX domain-containing protein [Listeria monocytogenes]EAE3052863.1 NUDIX domain-containing protein [Listeria monocytogenes]